MQFTYLPDSKTRIYLNNLCLNILYDVQDELKDYFTFSIELIGSGATKLLTINGKNNHIDLDYNLVIQNDKKQLSNNPLKIRELFLNALRKVCLLNTNIKVSNSKSVLTTYVGKIDQYVFSFDCAIFIKNNNSLLKLIYDKNSNKFIWNKITNTYNLEKRIQLIRNNNLWNEVRNLYIENKNKLNKKSNEIFIMTINTIYQRYENDL